MKHYLLTLYILFAAGMSLNSQDITINPGGEKNWFLHLESGIMYPSGTIKDNIAIRQNISSYYVNQSSDGEISSETAGFNLGLKCEYFLPRFNTGVSAGLRYTGYNSDISGYSASNADFFYLRYSMMSSDTKFARVINITETNNFISIPLEIRVVPIHYMDFGLFFKAGAEFSRFNIKKKTNINFQDESMEEYEDDILENITLPTNKNYSTLYGSIGVQYGMPNKTNYLFEIFLPSYYLSDNNFALTNVDYFQGFKFSVQIPLN